MIYITLFRVFNFRNILFCSTYNNSLCLYKTQALYIEILLFLLQNWSFSYIRKCVVTNSKPRFYAWYRILYHAFFNMWKYWRKGEAGCKPSFAAKIHIERKDFFMKKQLIKQTKKDVLANIFFYIFKNYLAVTTSDVPSTVADSVTSAKNSAGTYVRSLTISGAALSVSGIILPLT